MTSVAEPKGSLAQALDHAARLLKSNPQMAEEQASEILKAAPAHPIATLLLGAARRARGDAASALQVLQPLVLAQPAAAAAHYELGMTLADLGQHNAAIDALKRSVALKPDMPNAWREIGDRLTLQGDLEGGQKAYAQHLKAATRDPRLLAAASALCENQIPQAELMLREHLKRYPTDVAAIRMFAEVAGRLRRYKDAEKLLARCLELAPTFNAARYNYALALHRQNKSIAALQQIDILTANEPLNSGYRNLKAVVLANIGDYQESLELYADVLAKHPDQSRIWMSYGHALAAAGKQAESIEAYRRCIALAPTLGEAYYSLANLKTFRFLDGELQAMRAHVESDTTKDEDRAHFHFAIGKALEDAAQYSESFEHYVQGNSLRRAAVGWEPEANSTLVRHSKAALTQDFFSDRGDFGAKAADPIFIVGLPRAGSTLIEQILASHSCVEGTAELPDIMAMAGNLSTPYPEVLAKLTAAECRELGEQYLSRTRIQRKTARPFFIDKMPNNFLHIGLIHMILPNAKIIDARRHPMSCCFSGFKQNFAQGQRYTYSLEHIGKYYRDYTELMAHFDAVLPAAVHRVFYEDMIEDTEGEVRRLLDYCGLPFEAGTLKFYDNQRAVRTASSQQVRQPIFREGLEQWRHFEPWLEPLRQALGDAVSRYPDTPQF